MKKKTILTGCLLCCLVVLAIVFVNIKIHNNTENTDGTETYVEESHNYYYYYDGSYDSSEAAPLESPVSHDYFPTEK